MFFESRHIQYIRFTWSSIFFCLKPGNPSYQMEASSCWTFGCATNWEEIIFNLCICILYLCICHKLARNFFKSVFDICKQLPRGCATSCQEIYMETNIFEVLHSLYFFYKLKNLKKKLFKNYPFLFVLDCHFQSFQVHTLAVCVHRTLNLTIFLFAARICRFYLFLYKMGNWW